MDNTVGIYTGSDKKQYLVRIKNIRDFISLERRIVKDASYTREGHYVLTNLDEVKRAIYELEKNGIYYQDTSSKVDYLPRPILIDGSPVYEDVDNVTIQKTLIGPVVEFDAKRRVAPELAKYVDHFLYSTYSDTAVDEFLSYPNHEELVPLDVQIEDLYERINSLIKDRDRQEAKECLEKLDDMQEALQNGWYFDPEKLMKYYKQAGSMVELQEKNSKLVLTLDQVKTI